MPQDSQDDDSQKIEGNIKLIECQKRLLAMSFITFNDVCKNMVFKYKIISISELSNGHWRSAATMPLQVVSRGVEFRSES